MLFVLFSVYIVLYALSLQLLLPLLCSNVAATFYKI